ncbi:unnamed protein product [Symbiodinium natans]|uniref:Uncharacterized protein n=1 Tax=Symbiodinium natans TaxID=878477 RepID=A0A812P8Q4_9DINO|nr:unnamed protein product [Symbiodinium natans]
MAPKKRAKNAEVEALLCDQLEDLKKKRLAAKKAVKEAAKNEKNAIRKKNRLLKAAKNLSADDLQLLLEAKKDSMSSVPQCLTAADPAAVLQAANAKNVEDQALELEREAEKLQEDIVLEKTEKDS